MKFLIKFPKTEIKSLETQFENAKTQFENAKTQFTGDLLAWTGRAMRSKKSPVGVIYVVKNELFCQKKSKLKFF